MTISAVAPGTLGFVLNAFEDEINHSFHDQTHRTEIDAGRELLLAIENVKNTYSSSLILTLDKIPRNITQIIEQIKELSEKLKSEKESPQEIELSAQRMINNLPYSTRRPKLTLLYPKYSTVRQSSKEVLFKFAGSFPWSDRAAYLPALIINGKKYNPGIHTTQSFEFSVPASDLEIKESKRSYFQATLQVPWDNGWFFTRLRANEYKIWLGILPTNPGTVAMEYTCVKVNRLQTHIRTEDLRAQGQFRRDWVTKEFVFKPSLGWNLSPKSAKIVVHEEGQHGLFVEEILEQDSQVICNIKLAGDSAKNLGLINFHVEFDEYKDEPEVKVLQKTIPLGWGDSTTISLESNEKLKHITFDSFDGKSQTFSGISEDNHYLKITEHEGKLQLTMEEPAK